MIRQNLHCHTIFDDGADAPERMVLAAQAAGLGSLGISLHCPVSGQEAWCCSEENEPLFIAEMHRLREVCGGSFPVWCGLEYDLEGSRDFAPYDYVIASCHLLGGFSVDNTPEEAEALAESFGGAPAAAETYYRRVASIAQIEEADIVGHFDLLTKFNERRPLYDTAARVYRDAAFAAMETLSKAGKIFEINSGAISRGWRTTPYPAEKLLRHLKSIGGRILISSDAHTSEAMTCAFDQSEALAKRCGFTELWQFNGSGFEAANI